MEERTESGYGREGECGSGKEELGRAWGVLGKGKRGVEGERGGDRRIEGEGGEGER